MSRIDLHMHSVYSDDGELEPVVLMEMCKDAGISYMAIADHNSVKGSRIALKHQNTVGITCIPAIEIDATCEGVNYHILGYGIDVDNPAFDEIEKNVMEQELKASALRAKLVKELGIQFDEKRLMELAHEGIITGEVIGEAALEYDIDKQSPLLEPYRAGGNRSDNPFVNFYWDYCSSGKPAYVPIVYPDVKDIVELVHSQNGLVIVAHPGQNAKEVVTRMEALTALGIDGLEVYSSYHSPQQIAYYQTWAKEHNLLMTCGSDYHGKTKPAIHLGQCDMEKEDEVKLEDVLKSLVK